MKKILKSNFGRSFLAFIFYLYCWLVRLTSRIEFQDRERIKELFASGRPLIIAFWHGRLMMMPFFFNNPGKTYVMISNHGDGALIARAMDFFGVKYIRGSSNRGAKDKKGGKDRGGAEALRAAIAVVKRGDMQVITPDGPKGPRMRVQKGAISLGRITGAPILPATYSASRCKIFNSWDRFMLPLPFGKIIVECGELVYLAKDMDAAASEIARKTIENQLNTITRKADLEVGIVPVEPAIGE